tara:strand:+ start:400 stop:2268 length:1869 start_codon:yes stop_codon:yes gene_type:complete
VLDKTAATIVDKYAPLAFLETESTRRMIKRQLSPAFAEGGGAYLHRVTSAKVLAELEKLSEVLSEVEQDVEPGAQDIAELERIDFLVDTFSPLTHIFLDAAVDVSDWVASDPLGFLPPAEQRKWQQRAKQFENGVTYYKNNEKEILRTSITHVIGKDAMAIVDDVDKWASDQAEFAATVVEYWNNIADCKDLWSGKFFGDWFKDVQTGPIKFFQNLHNGKYKRQWAAIRDAHEEFATAVGKMEDGEDLYKANPVKAVNAGMKQIRNIAGVACSVIWENVKTTNPIVSAINTWLKTADKHCPAMAKEGNDFGVAFSTSLELEGGATIASPVKLSVAAGVEVGIGITARGKEICFVGAGYSASVGVGAEAGVGGSVSGNVIFFKDAGGITGTSNSAGLAFDLGVKLGVGVDFGVGLSFGLNQFVNVGDETTKLTKKTFKEVVKHMTDWTDISVSVTAGAGFGIGASLPVSASFGYSWTPLCVDTKGMQCGFKACEEGESKEEGDCDGYTEKQWEGLHKWWKTQKNADNHPQRLVTESFWDFNRGVAMGIANDWRLPQPGQSYQDKAVDLMKILVSKNRKIPDEFYQSLGDVDEMRHALRGVSSQLRSFFTKKDTEEHLRWLGYA